MKCDQALADLVLVVVDSQQQQTHSWSLEPGKGVFVGSARNSGIHLQGPDISPIHCRIVYDGQNICVYDWMSVSGTFIEGSRIEGEAQIGEDSQIQIGSYTLRFLRKNAAPMPSDSAGSVFQNAVERTGPALTTAADIHPTIQPTRPLLTPGELDDCNPFGMSPIPQSTNEHLHSSHQRNVMKLKDDSSIATERSEGDWPDDGWADDPFASLEYQATEDASADWSPSDRECRNEDGTDTHSLELRIRDLVLEAELNDQRILALEDLLLAAESAKSAQQEERECFESWLQDIERKFGQRENEHLAEVAMLKRAMDARQTELKELHQRLAATSGSDSSAQVQQTLEELRNANLELTKRLEAAERRGRELEQQLADTSFKQDDEIRAERAALAHERAELARQRYELVNELTIAGNTPNPLATEDTEMACRLRTLREHLREIHHQEQQDRSERSISSRISSLWQRVTQ